MNLQIRQTLQNLGFVEGELRALDVLFAQKKASTKIISQNTGISYDMAHFALVNLERKKLVRLTSENDEDIYEICNEKEFYKWIEDQKNKNIELYDNAQLSLKSLFTIIRQRSWKPHVQYFEGNKGIIDIYEDMLHSGNINIYSWLDIQKIHDALGHEYLMRFINERIKKDIKVHAIMPFNNMNVMHESRDENREARFVKNFPIEGEIRIYGDKVAVITFDKENPVGFLFQGKVITELFKSIFLAMWSTLNDPSED